MSLSIRVIILVATTVYQTLSVWLEEQKAPPGNLINLGQYRLHFCLAGEASPTIIIDHSLGGIEGYFLIEELSQLA
ncbi:MAG: alpha/beta hydrolase, partial [Microcystis sp.]